MRHAMIIGISLLLAAEAVGGDRPIPQDAARIETRFRDRLEWNRRTLQGAYDKLGKRDPRWDESARKALDLAASLFAQQVDPMITFLDVHVPTKKAVDAGCDDPLILYLYARSSVGSNFPNEAEYTRRIKAAADAMSASKYSPYRQAAAVEKAIELKAGKKDPTPAEKLEVGRELDALVDFLGRSAAEDVRNEDWEFGWFNTLKSIIGLHRQVGADYKAAFDRVDARLAKVPGIAALRFALKGNFLYYWGWEARTTAFANAVGADQFRTFETRLREARTALNAAWKANPGQPQVAAMMLEVEKAIGGGDREAMETWFERAMKSDGNDHDACWSKFDWLDPKWYGGDSPDEMMAFARACRATKNWRTGITLLAADAHLRYQSMLPPDQQAKYMRSPEVWSAIKEVYDEYLKHFPYNDVERSKYAVLCYLSSHYPEAHAQFQALGDRLARWPTFPNYPLESMKKMRDHTAQIVAKRPQARGEAASNGGHPSLY